MVSSEEKTILKLYEKIEKCHSEEHTTKMSELLTTLKHQTMTFDLLKSTKIGLHINQLRKKVSDKEIKQQMANLIKSWKSLAGGSGQNSEKTQEQKPDSTENPDKHRSASPASTIVIPVQLTGDAARDRCRELIAKALRAIYPHILHSKCNNCGSTLEEQLWKMHSPNIKI